MADKLSRAARSANMARVRRRDTGPELVVRRMVHALGYRYRLHVTELPGKPDLVFKRRKKIIFVHGCFWHGHVQCRRGARPTSNTDFWNAKLERNRQRDIAQLAALQRAGWNTLVVWECETKDLKGLEQQLTTFLED